ncbi:MFS transporter [Nocardia sp. NPDC127579]|uniref:MFS transporter n=1 Tax=Nocardia sp. NPDC127579 TaxID=3345402 RepID=UPI0036367BEB
MLQPAQPRAQLSSRHTFTLAASLIVSALASTSAPTPIYPIYQDLWGFTPVTVTVVFGTYAVSVLLALLTVGTLSDHVGRRPVLIAAVSGQILAMVVFAFAQGLIELLAARTIQGLATGAILSAVGATLIDIDRDRSALTNAVVPTLGCATGLLASALAVQHLPQPTQSIYLILIAVFAAQLLGVLAMRETGSHRPGGLASLRPSFSMPVSVRRPLFTAIPVVIATWALAGFYGSLGPTLISALSGSTSALMAASPMFLLTATGTLTVIALRKVTPETLFGVGIVALIIGLVMTLAAIDAGSVTGFYLGTLAAGVGFGGGFQGGIRIVVPHAEPHNRAGVISVLYSCCYLGFGAPTVVAGYLLTHHDVPLFIAREYGLALVALTALTIIGFIRRAPVSVREQ